MHATRLHRPAGIRALCAALGCILLLALVGCVAGDGVQASFTRQFSADPAVARVDLSTADNMPFTGGVGGTVFLRDSLSEAEVREFSERVREFGDQSTNDQQGSRVRIDLAVDGWEFPVLAAPAANDALLDLVYRLSADPHASSGSMSSKTYQDDISHVSVVAAATTALPSLITDAPLAFAAEGMTPSFTFKSPADEPVSVKLSGRMGPWAESAFDLYEALRAELPLTSFGAEETTTTVTLADESDLDRARSITETVAGPPPTDVFYQSDLITLYPGARGDQLRDLLAPIGAEVRAHLVSAWTDDSRAALTVTSKADLQEMARTITENRDSIALTSVTLAVGQGDALTFSVQAAPGDLATITQNAMKLAKQEHVTSLRVKPGFSIDVHLDSAVSDENLAAYAPLVKTLSTSGERLCVDWTTNSFCTDTAHTLDPAKTSGGGAERERVFVDAWNSAQ